jgi:hypothetical protein
MGNPRGTNSMILEFFAAEKLTERRNEPDMRKRREVRLRLIRPRYGFRQCARQDIFIA